MMTPLTQVTQAIKRGVLHPNCAGPDPPVRHGPGPDRGRGPALPHPARLGAAGELPGDTALLHSSANCWLAFARTGEICWESNTASCTCCVTGAFVPFFWKVNYIFRMWLLHFRFTVSDGYICSFHFSPIS